MRKIVPLLRNGPLPDARLLTVVPYADRGSGRSSIPI